MEQDEGENEKGEESAVEVEQCSDTELKKLHLHLPDLDRYFTDHLHNNKLQSLLKSSKLKIMLYIPTSRSLYEPNSQLIAISSENIVQPCRNSWRSINLLDPHIGQSVLHSMPCDLVTVRCKHPYRYTHTMERKGCTIL